MRITKENILSVCGKYLFIFGKNKKYEYWDNASPSRIFAINEYGFVSDDCTIYYFRHYLKDDCKIFISDNCHNTYVRLEDMNPLEEVDKESLRNLVEEIEND